MHGSESDVPADPRTARSRDVGGLDPDRPDAERPGHGEDAEAESDAISTTGVDRNEKFVGRVAGADEGYDGETGAEARAQGASEESR